MKKKADVDIRILETALRKIPSMSRYIMSYLSIFGAFHNIVKNNKHISINIHVRITNPSMVTGCAEGNYDARTQSRSS